MIHFNNAGVGLMPEPVLDAMRDYLELEARVGGYEAADERRAQIDDFYAAAGELLGCAPANVASTASATDSFSRALSSIPFAPGDVLLTTRDDYASNQIAFMSLRTRLGVDVRHAPNASDGGVDVEEMTGLMDELRPRLVAVTHIPTNSGLVQPVAEIGRRCRERDLVYLVDACQSIGQYALDVEELGCDFLSATSRKFLRGPRGHGLLYVSDRALAAGYEPLFIDMRGADWTSAAGYTPRADAKRFEEWEHAYASIVGAATAVRYALAVEMDAIAERAPALGAQLRERLAEIDGVRVLDRGPELCAIVTVAVEGKSGDELHAALAARGINSSVSYLTSAFLDFTEKDVGSCLRLSPHYYNTEDEVAEVAAAVGALVSR